MYKTYRELIKAVLGDVTELFPWGLVERSQANPELLVLDIREPYEFEAMHIEGSLNVPRGILESACEYGYEETVPELVKARGREIVLVCRSGYRSVLAAYTMQLMGYENVASLKTGVRGWNEYEQPLVDGHSNAVGIENADAYFEAGPTPEQMGPG